MNLNRPRHIGIDLDNTIIDYSLAYEVISRQFGLETELIDRESIRSFLRLQDDGNEWQRFQSILYTEGLISARPANGVDKFFELCRQQKVEISIISHKTEKTPIHFGNKNLRQCAVEWLNENCLVPNLVNHDHLYFCATQSEKVLTTNELGCDVFVDDLVEVLVHPELSKNTRKVLYVNQSTKNIPDVEKVIPMNFYDLCNWLERC